MTNIRNMTNPLIFPTKNKFAYDYIKKGIISGAFKPGERLVIRRLSQSLQISIIPIREAINRLTTEDLVLNTPHVGPTVTPIHFDDLREHYLIKSELEGLATLHAVPHLTEKDLLILEENVKSMKSAIQKNDLTKVGPINKEFHLIIYRACPYKKLYKLITDLWNNIDRLQCIFALVPSRPKSSLREHMEILNTLKKGDSIASSVLVKRQKESAWKDIERYYNSDNFHKLE